MHVERELDIDVVEAATRRIESIFANATAIYLSFSGGKDSLCIADLTLSLALQGRIDASRLTVHFIDEEAIFPCVEQVVRQWRSRFMLAGARFDWFCLEVRHYSCLNLVENDENFFCWDRTKRDVWIREPPPFAIRSHPLFKPRKDSYQDFLPRLNNGQNIVGLRASESVQRTRNLYLSLNSDVPMSKRNTVFPIYDWRDVDVWHYLSDRHVQVPDAYMHMYQIGVAKRQLRISQFFSVDTIATLAHLGEYYPELIGKVLAREPNAYLVSLYFDSEMFRRRTRTRRELEGGTARSYKDAVLSLLGNIPANFLTHHQRFVAEQYSVVVMGMGHAMEERDYRDMYEGLIAGDPKRRTLRAIRSKLKRNAVAAA